MNKCEVLHGRIEGVVYRNDANDYTVLDVSTTENELVTAVGYLPSAYEGETVVLTGEWTYHKEFGRQFSFDGYEKKLPEDVEGIIQYLSSRTIKGLGPVTALKIVNRYGLDTFDVIENHPEWLVDIPGITAKRAAAISESFREQGELRNVMIFFGKFIGTGEVTKIYKKMGASAVGIVRDNPYILSGGEFGLPFAKVDAIASSLGIDGDSENRVLAGIEYLLTSFASVGGHTCYPADNLASKAAELLGITVGAAEKRIEQFVRAGKLVRFVHEDGDFIMSVDMDKDEEYIASRIIEISEGAAGFGNVDISSLVYNVERQMGINYADLQREALFCALRGGAAIITGGPGTGKTTIIRALLSIFASIGLKTVLSAPTGRAAKRMSEATGTEAKTVHRMLEMERGTDGNIRFCRNSRSPLDEKVIIVDEASMMDVPLTAALLRACGRGARLILIGDSDQLPSVGAGNVLSDLISSGRIPTVCLTNIFRQGEKSLIVSNAHRINNGEPPVLNVTDGDFFFVKRENERDIAETVANLITTRLPKAYGEQISEGIQVITPSRKGAGGVELLNKELQSRINPPAKFKKEKQSHGVIFREGDRVMQTVNNYDVEWEKNGVVGYGIFNGDIGVIESVDMTKESMEIRFDDRLVTYGFELLDELELAYAITVHKSQGSEYPVVVVPMYACAPMLMTRNLLYTAVTRARNMVVLVGRSDIPVRMVENNWEAKRYTTLRSRLSV